MSRHTKVFEIALTDGQMRIIADALSKVMAPAASPDAYVGEGTDAEEACILCGLFTQVANETDTSGLYSMCDTISLVGGVG